MVNPNLINRKLIIYNILPRESKFLQEHVLDATRIDYIPVEEKGLIYIKCPGKLFVPKAHKNNELVLEFLRTLGYMRCKFKGMETYYMKYGAKNKKETTFKNILNNTPTLKALLSQ